MSVSPGTTLTGKIRDLSGTASQGKVQITLSNLGGNPPIITTDGEVAPTVFVVNAASDGTWSQTLFSNTQLSPSGTYYTIEEFPANSNSSTWIAKYILNTGTFAVSSLTPVSTNPVTAAYTPVVTNPNGSQSIATFPLALLAGGTSTTPDTDDDSTNIATTEYVQNQGYLTNAALADTVVAKNSTTGITFTNTNVFVKATGGAGAGITLTLPTAVGMTGQRATVKKIDSGVGTVTIATTSAQTIDGATTFIMSNINSFVTVESDGTNWYVVAQSSF